jgi:hypothetical protein
MTLATLKNMKLHQGKDIIAYSHVTNEEASANPDDYVGLPEGVALEDDEGVPMVLVYNLPIVQEV